MEDCTRTKTQNKGTEIECAVKARKDQQIKHQSTFRDIHGQELDIGVTHTSMRKID